MGATRDEILNLADFWESRGDQVEADRLRAGVEPDQHGNTVAREGCTRCDCGCKYWEHDRCTDCGTHVSQASKV